jgi:hypothetical protein
MARGRPRGDITKALIAAARQGPGTARELAERALVGRVVARFKVSAMIRRGDLIVIRAGRPALLALPADRAASAPPVIYLAAAWWPVGRAGDAAPPEVPTPR